MQVEEGEGHLDEPVEDLLLGEVLAFGVLDLGVDVAAITVTS